MLYGGFYFDPTYLLFLLPALLLSMYAQSRVRGAHARWSQVRNSRNMTGAEVAGVLMQNEKLSNIRAEMVSGELNDHYDPQQNILRLSPSIAQQPTIAAMAVAAHELGHAEQDRDGYLWMKVRSKIVPFVQIGGQLGYLVFFGGLMANSTLITWIGIAMFSLQAVFSLITLPVELDASNRALRMLTDNKIIQSREEYGAARNMLTAAALTYIAAVAQAVLTVLYYVITVLRSRDNNRSRF